MTDIKKIQKLLKEKKKNKPKIYKGNKLPKTFYCETCDRHYTKNNKQFHYESNLHKNNLGNNKGTRSNE